MYKIINTYNGRILYITDDYEKANEWANFYSKQLGVCVRIESINEYWVIGSYFICSNVFYVMW